MAQHATCTWTGERGKQYTYYIWGLPTSFKENQDGNYIYTKKSPEGKWVPIYIGQGDLKSRTDNHHQADCITRKGATHIHVHQNAQEAERLAEENDLLLHYTNAYQPTGCNVK